MSKHTIILKRIEKPGKNPVFMKLNAWNPDNSAMLRTRWDRIGCAYAEELIKRSGHKVILLQDWDGTKAEFLS